MTLGSGLHKFIELRVHLETAKNDLPHAEALKLEAILVCFFKWCTFIMVGSHLSGQKGSYVLTPLGMYLLFHRSTVQSLWFNTQQEATGGGLNLRFSLGYIVSHHTNTPS